MEGRLLVRREDANTPASQTLEIAPVGAIRRRSIGTQHHVPAGAFPVGFLVQRLSGASVSGTPTGKHGDALVSVRVTPQGVDLSTSSVPTLNVSADMAFVVTVEDSGDFQETSVPVTLTIDAGGKPIKKSRTIPLIQPAAQQVVTFSGFELPQTAFGVKATIKVVVGKVPGEVVLTNNSATYSAFFTLP